MQCVSKSCSKDGSSTYGEVWHWAGAGNTGPLKSPNADTASQAGYNISNDKTPQRRTFTTPTSEGDQRHLYGQGKPQAKNSSGAGANWYIGEQSQSMGPGYSITLNSRTMFDGTVTATDMDRATDAREKGRIGIFGTGNAYAGSSGRVTSERIGRDLNPLGRGDGSAYVGGAMNYGTIAPRLPMNSSPGGWGNSVNNGCCGGGEGKEKPRDGLGDLLVKPDGYLFNMIPCDEYMRCPSDYNRTWYAHPWLGLVCACQQPERTGSSSVSDARLPGDGSQIIDTSIIDDNWGKPVEPWFHGHVGEWGEIIPAPPINPPPEPAIAYWPREEIKIDTSLIDDTWGKPVEPWFHGHVGEWGDIIPAPPINPPPVPLGVATGATPTQAGQTIRGYLCPGINSSDPEYPCCSAAVLYALVHGIVVGASPNLQKLAGCFVECTEYFLENRIGSNPPGLSVGSFYANCM